MTTAIIKTKDGYKEITVEMRDEDGWLCKMAGNQQFVFGCNSDGTFAIADLDLLREYENGQ